MENGGPGEVLTLQEVAGRLRLPYRYVRDRAFSGAWPCLKISPRKRMMTESDVQAVISLLHAEPTPPPTPAAERQVRRSVMEHLNAA